MRQSSLFSRRRFLETTAAIAGASALPLMPARASAKYTRYDATSAKGQAMLKSYAVAVQKMMALPPDHPHNWFRNAFVHTLDCPHHNWWFFVWHRGFLGWFERTVRLYSGNPDFALPYWDWSGKPCIPDTMFDGVLTPTDSAYNPYISSYDTFHSYMNPAMTAFWNALSAEQLAALKTRMMPTLDSVWEQVKGDPQNGGMYATTPNARYLSASNACLDANTQAAVQASNVEDGLRAPTFADFNSGACAQHSGVGKTTGLLESQPHDLTHNNVGGYQHVPNADCGYMASNLSPVDPVFFLHHSNMDRLWDVWTRRQQALGRPFLPTGADLARYSAEKFLFYIDDLGHPVTKNTAGDYISIGSFDYDYQTGISEAVVAENAPVLSAALRRPFAARMTAGVASVAVPQAAVSSGHVVVANVTIPFPLTASSPREFIVLVNAPPGTTTATPDSPFYAGTVGFFGFMPGMTGETTFPVSLSGILKKQKSFDAAHMRIEVVPIRPATGAPRAPVGEGAPRATGHPLALQAAPPQSTLKAASVSVW